jgi:hypothetical protein
MMLLTGIVSALDSVAGTLIVIALCAAALLLLKYDARERKAPKNHR